jgi:hypothetical protein
MTDIRNSKKSRFFLGWEPAGGEMVAVIANESGICVYDGDAVNDLITELYDEGPEGRDIATRILDCMPGF